MAADRRFEPWPAGVTAALALGLAGPIAFLWLAVHSPPERVATDPWGARLAQAADERARGEGAARGWDVALTAERNAGGVRVELVPASAREPLPENLELRLRRERPERADLDVEVPLTRENGRWLGEVALPAPGRWQLRARVAAGDVWVERRFELEARP